MSFCATSFSVNLFSRSIPLLLVLVFLFAILDGELSCQLALIFLNFLFLCNNFLRVFLTFHGIIAYKEITQEASDLFPAQEISIYPVYTLLIPMFHESHMVKSLVDNICKLDYPKEKLDVKIIVEDEDQGTKLAAIKAIEMLDFCEIVIVPSSIPRTKPKACNYALQFARGEIITIYDAEDAPDPLQLKKVISLFEKDPELCCIQAKLNYYNAEYNLLTTFFAIEYCMTFDLMLSSLAKLRLPMPLGGTSNHFRTKMLQELGAWDPCNVTEDAEIGIRLYRNNMKCIMIQSYTLEEAPTHLITWIKQRARWIKGFIQTYMIHLKESVLNPQLSKAMRTKIFFILQFFILNPILCSLFAPLSLFAMISVPAWLQYFSFLNFIIWIANNVSICLFYSSINKLKPISFYHAILFSGYLLLQTAASYRAIIQIITRPFFWDKTPHGHQDNL